MECCNDLIIDSHCSSKDNSVTLPSYIDVKNYMERNNHSNEDREYFYT